MLKNALINETQNFLECDLLTAEKKADEWVKRCVNFYNREKLVQAERTITSIEVM